jgi:hypothetical protein
VTPASSLAQFRAQFGSQRHEATASAVMRIANEATALLALLGYYRTTLADSHAPAAATSRRRAGSFAPISLDSGGAPDIESPGWAELVTQRTGEEDLSALALHPLPDAALDAARQFISDMGPSRGLVVCCLIPFMVCGSLCVV